MHLCTLITLGKLKQTKKQNTQRTVCQSSFEVKPDLQLTANNEGATCRVCSRVSLLIHKLL